MSERYTKLFSLPEKLYAETSPVVIAAGALLKDNATGKVLAQIKFRNITGKTIKALRVCVTPLDTMGAALGDAVSHQYLDLSAGRDDEFGQKAPVTLPDAATRSYSVAVTEVIFADNSLWSAADAPWQVLPAPAYLSSVLRDRELEKQYCLKFGNNCQYNPAEHKDLWYCACGALNTKEDFNCHKCRNSRDGFFSLDMDALKAARDERLAAEAKKAAEEKAAAEAQAKKNKKLAAIIIPIVAVVIAVAIYVTQVIIPGSQYKAAEALLDAGEYDAAIEAFEALDGYKDSNNRIEEAEDAIQAEKEAAEEAANAAIEAENAAAYAEAEALLDRGHTAAAAIAFAQLNTYSDSAERAASLRNKLVHTIFAGWEHTVGLQTNNTVVATGTNYIEHCNVEDWINIVDISADWQHTVGLRSDGTVVATGNNHGGRCDVNGWTDIVAIDCGSDHTLGLKNDGTVVAVGNNDYGECDVDGWTEIVFISSGSGHSVGLKSDGTVVAVGWDKYSQCDVDGWSNIVAITAGGTHSVALKADGTVVAVGCNDDGQCNVDDWTDIVAISAGAYHTVGLKADGTAVAVGRNDDGQCNVDDWSDIVSISSGGFHTVGLKVDGTVVAVGQNTYGQCDVDDWTDIRIPD